MPAERRARGERHGREARRALVASGDRDAFQLASPATTILYPVRAGAMARIDPAGVRERYGVEPRQVPHLIALRGDPSDRLPGAKGVGEEGAASLLRRYASLEDMFADGHLADQAEALRLYKRIATRDAAAPIPALDDRAPTWGKAAALLRERGLERQAKRLGERSASG